MKIPKRSMFFVTLLLKVSPRARRRMRERRCALFQPGQKNQIIPILRNDQQSDEDDADLLPSPVIELNHEVEEVRFAEI